MFIYVYIYVACMLPNEPKTNIKFQIEFAANKTKKIPSFKKNFQNFQKVFRQMGGNLKSKGR